MATKPGGKVVTYHEELIFIKMRSRDILRDDVHIHLATLIGQRPMVGTRVKFQSEKPWQK